MESTFLLLLRSALFGYEIDPKQLPHPMPWAQIMALAKRQSVLGIIADAAMRLPQECRPDKKTVDSLRITTLKIVNSHAMLNRSVADCVRCFDAHGIPSVLLKGQGLASLYPTPELRTCGDVDIYVGPTNYQQACDVAVQELRDADTKYIPGEKHFVLEHNGVNIEIHRACAVLYTPWLYDKFFDWTVDELSHLDKCELLNIDGTHVNLPPADFNAFFIFYHLWYHFKSGGIGLRQLCDLAMFLHSHPDLDRSKLEADLRRFGLLRQWQIIASILVDHLGLPQDEMPLYNKAKAKDGRRVLDSILTGGNFGRFDPLQQFYYKHRDVWIKRKALGMGIRLRVMALRMRYDPMGVASSNLHYLRLGITHSLRTLFKKDD